MAVVSTYFKRYRMEADLSGRDFPMVAPPPRYRLLAWAPQLLEAHAQAKYQSFRDEIDAHVFPCLGDPAGCLRLMQEIAAKPGFLPGATWLAVYDDPETAGWSDYVGTIQGLDTEQGCGSIQNLGVVPAHRGRGLAKCLLRQALDGFRRAGLLRVSLEVTAENRAAIRLYRDHGFRTMRTLFKSAEVAHS
jgi:GNAT superfamily N-acetyltransferase